MWKRLFVVLRVSSSFFFCFALFEITLRASGYNPFESLLDGRELIPQKSDNAIMLYEPTPNSEGIATVSNTHCRTPGDVIL